MPTPNSLSPLLQASWAQATPLTDLDKSLASQLGVTHEALYRTLADLEKCGEITRIIGADKTYQISCV